MIELPKELKVQAEYWVKFPTRANPTDAGFDLYWPSKHGEVTVHKGETTDWLDLGIAVELPLHWALHILPRSSLGKKGLVLSNTVGLIDHTYRENIGVSLYGRNESITLVPGQRFAQAVLAFNPSIPLVRTYEIETSNRGGMGSTGE